MFDEDALRARARALVGDSTPADDAESVLRQRVGGTGNVAVQGNNNQVNFNASSRESYSAYTTAELVEEQHRLAAQLEHLQRRHSNASILTIGMAMSPPVFGLLAMKHLPSDLMMAGWMVAIGAGVLGWLFGLKREAQLARACRAVAGKLEAVQAHLLHRSNWHPLGARDIR